MVVVTYLILLCYPSHTAVRKLSYFAIATNHNSRKFEIFLSEWRKGMIIKIPKGNTRLPYDKWRGGRLGICMLAAVVKILVKY